MNNNASCPQCRLAVQQNMLQLIHLTAAARGHRRSSIFNSSICQDYRELNEKLLTQHENNMKEIASLKEKLQQLVEENSKLKMEQIKELINENEMRKELSGRYNNKNESEQSKRQGPILIRHQSVDSFKNVQSVVAKAWKKN